MQSKNSDMKILWWLATFFILFFSIAASVQTIKKNSGDSISIQARDGTMVTIPSTGDYLSVESGLINFSDLTVINLTSLTLTPGDWDVAGFAYFDSATTATIDLYTASLSTVSATLDGSRDRATQGAVADGTVLLDLGRTSFNTGIGPARFNVAVNTTVYLTARVGVVSGTSRGIGKITARKIRPYQGQ